MNSIENLVDRYLETWNETDAARRRERIRDVYTEDILYTDPLVAITGHEGIDGVIAAAQQQLSGLRLQRLGSVDAHHDTARFTWHVQAAGSDESLLIGFDVITVKDGRVHRVYGFLDKVPAAAA